MIVKGDALHLPFADKTFDLCVGSPPYLDARLYLEDGSNLNISRPCEAWVNWMLEITTEALRVTNGLVVWVCAGTTKGRNYQPGPEGLLWEWFKRGGECHSLRPVYWKRVGIPGSGGDQWYRSDVEYCLAFKRPGGLPYARPKENGKKPLAFGNHGNLWGFPNGGIGRDRDGSKVLRRGHIAKGEIPTDPDSESTVIANPGNLLAVQAGGGRMGHKMASENEAAYPVKVPEFFIASHCPPGGLVLDPFVGSGTTIHAAMNLGRRGVGMDMRQSQCKLATRRLSTITPGFGFS